jgi:hypothetical protein
MMTNYQKKQEYFLEKLALLEKAKAVLKTEFIGIDTIIDEITSNVSAWFCFPELQEKPIVINLWGLTGVGKTSLINRLVELIDFKNHYYRFDLGEKEGDYSFRRAIDYLGKSEEEKPAIIMFDEFQHTRSINHQKVETENDKNRMVWELLDSGKITFLEWKRGTYAFAEFVSKFHAFARNGLTVENGYVTSFIKEYDKEMCVLCFEEGKENKISVIPDIHLDYILNITNKHYDISIESQLEEFIKNKSVEELKVFFDNILDLGQRPVTKYLNKSLIFVLGNLDEAYTMSGNLNSDIDADVFHELSKEINVPQIKKALKERFRNEQIARLGNIHIIYPAFSRKNYEDIISLELNKFKKKVEQQLQINITFKPSVNELIYKEGVYPTQGVRPIFTTIYQLIKSKIGEIYSQIIIQKAPIDEIEFEIIKSTLVVQFFKGEVKIDKKEFSLSLILSDLRKNKKDELQAICAVHEAGHAILNVALMNTLPEMIFSVTANADSEGFVYAKYNWDYIAKNEILPRMAVMLGGLAAEELIFGAENVTLGAAGDIDQATAFLMHHYMRSGMGDVPIKYVQNNMEIGYTNISDIQNKVKETIIKAKELALITLQNEKKLLIELANFLSNESTITQEHFLEMVNAFASKKPQINSRQNSQLYRKRLQELKNELDKECKTEATVKATYFSLNKDKH